MFFEDFSVGQETKTPTRTVTEADVVQSGVFVTLVRAR